MKKLIAVLTLPFLVSCNSTNMVAQQGDLKYQQLMLLPNLEGFQVSHSPNPVYLQRGSQLDGYGYSWNYQTTVSSKRELTIKEFGAFNLVDNVWILSNFTGQPFTKDDFEDWYSCPNSIIKPKVSCTDSNNWSASDFPTQEKSVAIWYFIGEDVSGQQYKATKEITEIGKLAD